MIEVKDLVKKYGNVYAVDHLNMVVEEGQIVGLLGANGAGKSTTMNILTGYISATEGSVKIGDYDILEDPVKAKQQIGYLPEIPPLYQDMTVYGYLKFVAEIKKVKKSKKKESVEEAMAKTQITDRAFQLIRQLSKGYRQRVGLAASLIGNPKILILDEPTVGLDPNQIIEIRELIKSLGKEHTVILSSHILQEVSAVCDHVIIINKGKVIAEDTPKNLSAHLSNAANVTLEAKGSKDAISNVLDSIESVDKYEFISEENGVCQVLLTMTDETDRRDEMTLLFAGKGIPVYRMLHETLSLEDVFLKLTAESKKEEDAAKEAASKEDEDSKEDEESKENEDTEKNDENEEKEGK